MGVISRARKFLSTVEGTPTVDVNVILLAATTIRLEADVVVVVLVAVEADACCRLVSARAEKSRWSHRTRSQRPWLHGKCGWMEQLMHYAYMYVRMFE